MPTRQIPDARARSPIGQRAALLAMLASLLVFPLGAFLESRRGPDTWGPEVGDHLHGLTSVGKEILISGHDGAGVSSDDGWSQSPGLSGRHVLGQIDLGDGTSAAMVDGSVVRARAGENEVVPGPWRSGQVVSLGAANGSLYVRLAGGGLLRSPELGAAWVRDALVGGLQPLGIVGADTPRGRDVVAVGPAGQLLRADRVVSTAWRISPGLQAEEAAPVTAVSPDPTRFGVWAAVVGGRLATSSDDGRSWTFQSAPEDLQAVTFDDTGALVVGTTVDGRALLFDQVDGSWRART